MIYGSYNLTEMGIPKAAHPDPERSNAGAHSYTISRGKVRLEVLLRNRAFYIKSAAAGKGPTGQLSFSKFGDAEGAWKEATARSGWYD